jgi:TRAP-type C4-dicarboxylate transport system substrate-binding protein
MKSNEVDQEPFRKAVQPLYEEYIAEYGPEAKKVIDIIQSAE